MINKIYAKLKNFIKENYGFLISAFLIIAFFNIFEFFTNSFINVLDKQLILDHESDTQLSTH